MPFAPKAQPYLSRGPSTSLLCAAHACVSLEAAHTGAIVDEMSGEIILGGSGAPGELLALVRSPLVMSRYWSKPER